MAFFVPGSIQKRLIRYALSRLELLDTDALDLDNLDIVWGKRSTVELRGIGIRVQRLSSLLRLPATVQVTTARILLLRLTVPADIYSSGIVVEIEGVDISARVLGDNGRTKSSDPSSKPQAHLSRTRPSPYDPGGIHRGAVYGEDKEDAELPTTQELAKSFLDSESPREKRQLEAAVLSQSQMLQQSVSSDSSGDTEPSIGTGAGLSLPTFLAKFLEGVVDRLEVSIVSVVLHVEVDVTATTKDLQAMDKEDGLVSVVLCVEKVGVEGLTLRQAAATSHDAGEFRPEGTAAPSRGAKKRCISLMNIYADLVAAPAVFDNSSHISSPSSHSNTLPDETGRPDSVPSLPNPVLHEIGSPSPATEKRTKKLYHGDPNMDSDIGIRLQSDDLNASVNEHNLRSSMITDDGSRFADATDVMQQEFEPHTAVALTSDPMMAQTQTEDSVFGDSVGEHVSVDNLVNNRLWDSGLEAGNEAGLPFAPGVSPPLTLTDDDRGRIHMNGDVSKIWKSPSTQQLSRTTPELQLEDLARRNVFYRPVQSQVPAPSLDVLPTVEYQQRQSTIDELAGKSSPKHYFGISHGPDVASNSSSRTPSPSVAEDLAQSRVFSHEEAESMYMSAFSIGPGDNKRVRSSLTASRALNNVSDPEDEAGSIQFSGPQSSVNSWKENAAPRPGRHHGLEATSQRTSEIPSPGQGSPVTTSSQSIQASSPLVDSDQKAPTARRRMFEVDEISLWLPVTRTAADSSPTSLVVRAEPVSPQSVDARSVYPDVPGTFPTVRLRDGSARLQSNTARKGTSAHTPTSSDRPSSASPTQNPFIDGLEVCVGRLMARIDISTGRLIVQVVQQFATALGIASPQHESLIKPSPNHDTLGKGNVGKETSYECRLCHCSLVLLANSPGTVHIASNGLPEGSSVDVNGPGQDPLLTVTMNDLDLSTFTNKDRSEVKATVGEFRLDLADKPMLCFDQEATMKTSTRHVISAPKKDVFFKIIQTKELIDVGIYTRPIQICLDLQGLDDALSCVGGFSSIIELGNSMASNSTVVAESPKTKQRRGVRFEGLPEEVTTEHGAPRVRVESRVGGAKIQVYGSTCSVLLRTSAIKVIARQQGVGMRIDNITLSGPHIQRREDGAPITVQLGGIKLEFAFTPTEIDLDKLLCLLTPSQDKYESDDDILIDTLLRQRRKGSVFRIVCNSANVRLEHRKELFLLQPLSGDIARLSTVAKYLPEDDRPGILTLVTLNELKVQATTNSPIGTLDLMCAEASAAYVGLPSLVAFGIEKISLHRNEKEPLIGEVSPQQSSNRLPMLMARIIGDEIDPTLKVKLWNLCLEYHVPTVVDLMEFLGGNTAEAMSVDVAVSVATVRNRSGPGFLTKESSGLSDKSSTSLKPLSIDFLMRHCAVGLNPRDLPSKGLFVLTDSRLAGSLPGKESLAMTLDIRKASFIMIDDIASLSNSAEGSKPVFSSIGSPQLAELCRRGYVSVATVSAAKAIIRVMEGAKQDQQFADVELRDELFVLETCADSTQTLFEILGGLTPPMPPSKEIKYRTEVVPVHDMLASFTSDAFTANETIDDLPLHSEEADALDDENPIEFEYDGSFRQSSAESPFDECEEDLLSSPFERLARPLADHHVDGTPLLESFDEHSEGQPGNSPLDIQEDYFGVRSEMAGTTKGWDSARNTYGKTERTKVRESPLKVRMREVHIIWNLFDGYDWQRTRDTISKAVKDLEIKAEERKIERRSSKLMNEEDEESVIGDFLFNSIYIGIPANREPRDLSRQINRDIDDVVSETGSYATTAVSQSPSRQGAPRAKTKRLKLNRSKHHKIAFELKGVSADVIVFPPGSGETQSSVDVRVNDFEIFDLVPTSTWKKFMTYMHDAGEREMGRPMFHLELLNVRPVPNLAASELVMRVSVLPLRLHVDQDALDFITRFFEFKDDTCTSHTSRADEPFLQRVEVNAVQIKLDYKPKKVDYAGLRSGHTNEFKNFFILDGADMVLRHVIIYGILGFDKLHQTLNDIWTPDVLKNQLPGVLSGLGPMRSLVNLAGGVRDLVVIPVDEYRRDGRIGRSISRGAVRFVRTTGGELARLGTKLAIGTQTALQGAEDFFVKPNQNEDGGWEDAELDEDEKKVISLYADQPVGVMQGLRGAAKGLQRDLLTARDAIVAIPGEVMDSGSAGGAAKAVLRHAPTIILRPGIGATKAISQTLMGATNSLDPQNRRRIDDKYKRH